MSKIYVGDIGTKIILDTGVDLSSASVLQIKLLKPGESSYTAYTATQVETTKAQYVVASGIFDTAGLWKTQVYAELDDLSWIGHGSTVQFRVYQLQN